MSSFLMIQTANKPNTPKKTRTLSQLTSLISAALISLTISSHTLAVPIEQGSLSGTANASTPPSGTLSTGASADSQGSTLWQLYQQVQQLQQEVRELRGQMEAQQDGLDRTQKDLKNRYTDLDQRLELLKEQSQPAEEDANADASAQDTASQKDQAEVPTEAAPAATPPATPEANKPDTEAPTSPPATPASSSSPNGNTTTKKTSSATKPTAKLTASATATSSNTEPDKQAYIGAYDAYKLGGAAKAIKPMQQFIASFPNSVYVPNAYYWLGEFYLAITPADFVKAKKSFNEVVNKYPKSSKASTALYRVATITQEIDKRSSDALVLMKKLAKEYPNSAEAEYARGFISTRT
jgi:tol-pal system protein YbgF